MPLYTTLSYHTEQHISSNETEGIEENFALLHKLLWKLVTTLTPHRPMCQWRLLTFLTCFPNYHFQKVTRVIRITLTLFKKAKILMICFVYHQDVRADESFHFRHGHKRSFSEGRHSLPHTKRIRISDFTLPQTH